MSAIKKIESYARAFRRYGEPWEGRRGYRLYYNENLFLPEDYYREIASRLRLGEELRLYTDPYSASIRERLSEFYKIPAENIFFSSGVDRIISMATDLALSTGCSLVTIEPTYEIYFERASSRGLKARAVPLGPGFTLDAEAVKEAAGDKSIILFPSPNNPTGNAFSIDKILELADTGSLVVVDEAYAEYSEQSLLGQALEYDNLAIMRSFSKAWGLANLRAGFLVASEKVVEAFMHLDEPYSVSSVVKEIISAALDLYEKYVVPSILETRRVREWLYGKLESLGLEPYPSQANFILFRYSLEGLGSSLAERGFLLKDTGSLPMLENTLRVTIPPMNVARKLVEALEEILADGKSSYM